MNFNATESVGLPRHHIDGDMLVAYAAGTLGQAESIVVATHLSLCPSCRAGLAATEAVGGALLEDIAPAPIFETAIATVLSRLDGAALTPDSPKAEAQTLSGVLLPRCVRDHLPEDLNHLRWSWVSPGVKYAEMLKDTDGVRIGLILGAAGAKIAEHGHSGEELTVVLSGGYRDGGAQFRRGDIHSMGEATVHQPVIDADGECLSLLMLSGPIKPTQLIARIFRRFTSF